MTRGRMKTNKNLLDPNNPDSNLLHREPAPARFEPTTHCSSALHPHRKVSLRPLHFQTSCTRVLRSSLVLHENWTIIGDMLNCAHTDHCLVKESNLNMDRSLDFWCCCNTTIRFTCTQATEQVVHVTRLEVFDEFS